MDKHSLPPLDRAAAASSGRLAGRVALVTGAGSGIGAATAARLARDGARVTTTDRSGSVDLLVDVTAPDAAEQMVAAAVAAHGSLDTLVACAGISGFEAFDGHSDSFWDATLAVNVTAVFRLVRAALAALRRSGRGRIVTLGSTMSSFGSPGLSAYSASKHAVLGLSRSLASELGPLGIAVNCVQPGAIATPMTAGAFADVPGFRDYWAEQGGARPHRRARGGRRRHRLPGLRRCPLHERPRHLRRRRGDAEPMTAPRPKEPPCP